MPQPLSKVRPDATVVIGPGAIFRERSIGMQAMLIVQIWAQIDVDLTDLATRFLKADFLVVSSMLEAIASNEGRKAALLGAAKEALKRDQFELLSAIVHITEPARRQRNAFVHHIWGHADEIPNAILLIDPKHLMRLGSERALYHKSYSGLAGILAMEDTDKAAYPELDQSKIMVYRDGDIGRCVDEAIAASTYFTRFFTSLYDTPGGEKERLELSADPAVQRALQRLFQKSSP